MHRVGRLAEHASTVAAPPDARAHEYDELADRYVETQIADDFVGIELLPDVAPLYPSHRVPLIP